MLVDVHAHLDFPQFDSDRVDVIGRARSEGIYIVNSGLGPEGIVKTISLAREYGNITATLGLSPQEFRREVVDETLKLIRKHRNDISGIGEVGLDYYWVKDSVGRGRELEVFNVFIGLSQELNLPLVVHSRDAEGDVIQILKAGDIPALLHSFSGSLMQAEEAVSSGCLISIPASVIYSKNKQRLVENLPLESIVLESDAPFLSPEPKTRNEPSFIKLSKDKVAELKDVDGEIVEEVTTRNAKNFFGLTL